MSRSIYRTDLLAHAMNPGKEKEVLAVVRAWRKCAEIEKVGRRGTSRDPRRTNPYFKQFAGEELASVILSGNESTPAASTCASKP